MSATTSLVTGVDFIAVPTQDYEKADAFYGDVLGLERSKRWGDMPAGEFENGTVTIAIMQSDAFGLEFSPHSHPIAFQVDDVAAAARRWRSRACSSCPTTSTAGSATWPTSATPTATR